MNSSVNAEMNKEAEVRAQGQAPDIQHPAAKAWLRVQLMMMAITRVE